MRSEGLSTQFAHSRTYSQACMSHIASRAVPQSVSKVSLTNPRTTRTHTQYSQARRVHPELFRADHVPTQVELQRVMCDCGVAQLVVHLLERQCDNDVFVNALNLVSLGRLPVLY